MLREFSVSEQRYQAVLAVIAEGRTVSEVAAQWGVSRQSVHSWLARYEAEGLEGLSDRSHRPVSSPLQMPAEVEALVLELRRQHRGWGPRRLVFEVARRGVEPLPSESGVYRALRRAGAIEPGARRRRKEQWRRWERGSAMELWQMDIVGGFLLADGSTLKCLTGVDDHSRLCVSAKLMRREVSRSVCEGLTEAMRRHGIPAQILTDNGKVFTGRFNHPPVEMLFDRICRENGVDHILTAPRSPTTTGKIERFHRSLRAEFLTGRVFAGMARAQAELDAWVADYNSERPHQSLAMQTPAARFAASLAADIPVTVDDSALHRDRSGNDWVTRSVSAVGVVCVAWQQISVGKHRAGSRVDVHVMRELLQIWDGNELIKTVARTDPGKEVRVKKAFTMPPRGA
jgi:transposase InsO family protein